MSTLWSGRFEDGPAEALWAFTVSLPYDRRLAPDDVRASIAHVRGLGRVGLVTAEESALIVAALERVGEEVASDSFVYAESDEDVHTAIERRVTELAGAAGGKLHTGRSRNDQVATALRLWTKRAVDEVVGATLDLADVFARRAAQAEDAYLPGYTHLQRAQPVLLAHHLLAHGWALLRDAERLLDGRARVDVSPLGAGAIAGSSLPLEPDEVARELGFGARFENSIDATSDRDFVAEALSSLALLGVHLSRIGEEIVLWSSEEFGFLRLPDAYSTGSSMLPQKKNPDIAELARGKAGRLIGHAAGFLATLKGLPLAYNRDLQEDKEPLFDAVDQALLALRALSGLLDGASFDHDRMRAAADTPTASAVDLAEWLVERGTPFREAHGIVGELVRASIERKVPLGELVAAHPALGGAAGELLEPGVPVTRRQTAGGTGPAAVRAQGERFARARGDLRARLAAGENPPGAV